MPTKDPYKYFRVEARDLYESLRQCADGLENPGQASASVRQMLRLAHTLKGAARVVKLTGISDHAHQLEDLLDPFRDSGDAPTSGERATVSDLLERLAGTIDAIDQVPAAEPIPGEPSAPTAPFLGDTVRLYAAEVDAALSGVSETSAELSSLRSEISQLENSSQQARRIQLLAARINSDISSRLAAEAGEFANDLSRTRQRLQARAERIERDLTRLHDDTGRLRLAPVSVLRHFLEQASADAAGLLGKRVRLEMSSGTARLDTSIFAHLQEALLHLVRNAVAHGIESEEERRSAGKEPEGTVRLSIVVRHGQLTMVCEDDGRGIDTDAVRRVALAKGWLPPERIASLSMEEAVTLLRRGGMSTATGTDQVSGRGVGLDAVTSVVARLDGTLDIQSWPGEGTRVTITAPATLSALDALVMEAVGNCWLLPLVAVREVCRVARTEIRPDGSGLTLYQDGRSLPYCHLSQLTGLLPALEREALGRVSVIIVQSAGTEAALGIDRLTGITEAIVRPLPDLAESVPFVVGASLEAAGPPRLLLDEDALIAAIRRSSRVDTADKPPLPPILVVDDSLTTRMLEQSILESAGYSVDLAVSGEDALNKLQDHEYGLLLVDVEMPGIDGFTLVQRLRDDPARRHLPIILVTSLESPEDRQRGLDAGAQDYVVKGEFDQGRLLRRIEELLS